jgi:hypothetical protein
MENNITDGQKVKLDFFNSIVIKINFFERTLMGIVTLAMVGWGFLHTKTNSEIPQPGLIVFSIIFSGMIGTSYNILFIIRNIFNIVLLEIKATFDTEIYPYSRFVKLTGNYFKFSLYIISLFVPLLALCSMIALIPELKELHSFLIWTLWVGIFIITVISIIMNCLNIEKLINFISRLNLRT